MVVKRMVKVEAKQKQCVRATNGQVDRDCDGVHLMLKYMGI